MSLVLHLLLLFLPLLFSKLLALPLLSFLDLRQTGDRDDTTCTILCKWREGGCTPLIFLRPFSNRIQILLLDRCGVTQKFKKLNGNQCSLGWQELWELCSLRPFIIFGRNETRRFFREHNGDLFLSSMTLRTTVKPRIESCSPCDTVRQQQ